MYIPLYVYTAVVGRCSIYRCSRPLYVYATFLLLYSSIDGHVCCSRISAIMSNAAVKMGAQISLWNPAFGSFQCVTRVEVLDHVVILYNVFKHLHSVFQSVCAVLNSHHQCERVPISPLPCQYSFPVWALTVVILTGVGCDWSSDLHSPNDYWYWSSFHVYWPFVFLLWRNVYSSSLPIF